MWLILNEGRSNVGWKVDEEEGWLVLWWMLVLPIDDVPAQGIG